METTRHFVATVYVVNDGAVALHEHEKLEMWLPPGGHIDRDELPHEAALREVNEETGLDVDLVADAPDIDSAQARTLPHPQQLQLEDINAHQGDVGHQHIDFVYFAQADHRRIDPNPDEQPASDWSWFDAAALADPPSDMPADVCATGRSAIETVTKA